jgi:hypothetical protein
MLVQSLSKRCDMVGIAHLQMFYESEKPTAFIVI